jgi:hypothetical protein
MKVVNYIEKESWRLQNKSSCLSYNQVVSLPFESENLWNCSCVRIRNAAKFTTREINLPNSNNCMCIHANFPDLCRILPIWNCQKGKSRYPDWDCKNTPKSRLSKNISHLTTTIPNLYKPKFKIPRHLQQPIRNQDKQSPLLFTLWTAWEIGASWVGISWPT